MQQCKFCTQEKLVPRYQNVFHKVEKAFGPFDIAVCDHCGSAVTTNLPSLERLAEFYRSYEEHRPEWYNKAKADGQLAEQYGFYANHIMAQCQGKNLGDWADIGAGHGEIASLMSARAPDTAGHALDIPPRPDSLDENIRYQQIDLNIPGWRDKTNRQFNTVYSVAVWEHVRDPVLFAEQSLSLVAPGGKLILICPAYDTLARKVLGISWPYFQPGEHLFIPSLKGAEMCLKKVAQSVGRNASITVQHINVGYNIRYVARVAGASALTKVLPNISIPAPTGILSATVSLSE